MSQPFPPTALRRHHAQTVRDRSFSYKIDGVGPIDNRPSTNKLHHCVKKKNVTCDMGHVTHDMWHVTCDMWHMTHDLFEGGNILLKFQLPSSDCLWFMILWRSGGKGSLNDWINESMNHKAVYRTAPALCTAGKLLWNPRRLSVEVSVWLKV